MTHIVNSRKEKFCEENVLVLQGGGSLGAYECGVYKAIDKLKIKCDVVAGTSIGGVNASIISASKSDEPAKDLENFWLELAETITPPLLPKHLRQVTSSLYSAVWGNPHVFVPLWFNPMNFVFSLPYLYDITPLKNTLKQYVDFSKLKDNNRPRLIVTSTDIQNGKSSIFDSKYDTMIADYVLASAGYPFYGISWTKVSDRYLWDGTLLSNTPLREVIDASPTCDKRVIIANLFPHNQEELPQNMAEAWHRARDIMHTDKTDQSVRMSRTISRHLRIIKEMYDILQSTNLDGKNKKRLAALEPEYDKIACERGAIIKEIVRIEREEKSHYLLEDADFSVETIKGLIQTGENDAKKALKEFGKN